ncbi:MAG: hypothetical protein OXM03_07175 [Chloroflexota bacterium]|nr:hypothetical protein [Chloroflexota bacterium]MDE2840395.1 hypothetical protein [Chloroflexota bacterium]MDE2931279.1 hypothetical protein [Chloroflexota bacterium]
MKRLVAILVLGLGLALLFATSVGASVDCQFVLGFKTLRDLVGHETVGECLENEHHDANGDSVQHTTGGLLVWRKQDNRTAFTDGYRTWINGPNGLQQRLNSERFAWEHDYAPGGGIATPTPTPIPTPSPTPTQRIDPRLGRALQALQTTSLGRTLRAWFTEAAPSLTFGTAPKGWTSRYHEPPRNEIVIDAALRNESADVLAALIAWETVLAVNSKRRGPQSERWRSGTDCLNEVVDAEGTLARWWISRFGRQGLRDANTATERMLNYLAQSYRDQTLETTVLSSAGYREWCAQYGTLPPIPEPEQFVDPLLEADLQLMRTTEFGEDLYAAYRRSNVNYIGFDDLSRIDVPHVLGVYSVNRGRILLDDSLREASQYVRVAVLVHELFHARPGQDFTDFSTEQCFEEETLAFSAQARWWREKFGVRGKRNPTEGERRENSILRLWLAGRIDDWVRQSEGYQEACARHGD